ncbi:hypothetical protein GCM10007968_12600 [Sporolactobacillus putidus]|uniref:Uncharacterized protein n=1 Tax=Sporolactobacillus putidus TaxID=492735 RepID=A0A917S104_9BACL|nr:hypothetical protein GCM10007968_12600 [Sporolactobacillus putidus]
MPQNLQRIAQMRQPRILNAEHHRPPMYPKPGRARRLPRADRLAQRIIDGKRLSTVKTIAK